MRAMRVGATSYFATALLLSVAGASPVPILNLQRLTAESDVVVLGAVTAVMDAGPMSVRHANGQDLGRRRIAEIALDEVLKGEADPVPLQVEFFLPDLPSGRYGGLAAGEYRVIFLKRTGERYEFTSHYHPSVVSIRGTHTNASATPFDRVVEAVTAVLRTPGAPEPLKRSALFAMFDVNTPASVAGLELLLTDPDQGLRLNAVAALLRSNHLGALAIAEAVLLRADPAIRSDLVLNLRGGIALGITTEAAIPTLVRLLGANEVETRRAAVESLRRMKSDAVIDALAKALDDPDLMVQYGGVSGLAEITGQRTRWPSIPSFQSNPEPHVRYWKEWLRRRQISGSI